jgi:hypothetical protein
MISFQAAIFKAKEKNISLINLLCMENFEFRPERLSRMIHFASLARNTHIGGDIDRQNHTHTHGAHTKGERARNLCSPPDTHHQTLHHRGMLLK